MEKVTVVVPFYNVEAYIEQCLDSLVNQTHHNLEILCIDDCSLDNTLNIVNSYAIKDSRIEIIRHEKNKGLGGARNTGIAAASADYICFVDSDDYVSINFVERLHQTLKKEGADISVCGFHGFGDGESPNIKVKYSDSNIIIGEIKDNVFHCARQIRGASWLKMYRRSLLCDNHILQPEHRYYEGVLFWMKSVYHSTKISTISDVLYHYRQREGSIMRSFSHKHIEDRFDYIEQIDDFFRTDIITTPGVDIYKAINDALTCIMEHLYYGETLIRDFGGESTEDYMAHFHRELLRFTSVHNWPMLPREYKEYSRVRRSRSGPVGQWTIGKSSIDELQGKLHATEKNLEKKKRELQSLCTSRSWRITAPLRKAGGLLKKW